MSTERQGVMSFEELNGLKGRVDDNTQLSILNLKTIKNKNQNSFKIFKETFGSDLIAVYPLNDIESSDAIDYSDNKRNATYTGAPKNVENKFNNYRSQMGFDGSQYLNLSTADIQSAIDITEGMIFLNFNPVDSDFWDVDATKVFFSLYIDADNQLFLRKGSIGIITAYYEGQNSAVSVSITNQQYASCAFKKNSPISLGFAWSMTNDIIDLYINGIKVGSASGLSEMLGSGASIRCGEFCEGQFNDVALVSRYVEEYEVRMCYQERTISNYNMTIIGDSIDNDGTDWPVPFVNNATLNILSRSYAIAGDSIVTNMSAQVDNALFDNSEIVIISLGRNDNNDGDMYALKTILISQIERLKLSNANGRFYYMGVLPSWTDISGAVEIELSNIRLAIQGVCESLGVNYIDTYTSPWIVPSDTVDGTHPSATIGSPKVANKMLEVIENDLINVANNM